MRERKIFLANRVRIAWNARLSSPVEKSKCAGMPEFIGLMARLPISDFLAPWLQWTVWGNEIPSGYFH